MGVDLILKAPWGDNTQAGTGDSYRLHRFITVVDTSPRRRHQLRVFDPPLSIQGLLFPI
jgi:hypothetical protein